MNTKKTLKGWHTLLIAIIVTFILPFSMAAQNVKPNFEGGQMAKSKLVQSKKANAGNIEKKASSKNGKNATAGKKKSKKQSATGGDIGVQFYTETTEEEKQLDEMTDYELEVQASKGDTDAQYLIGNRWVFSEADDRNDLIKGMSWLKKASDNNHSYAQALLGYCFYCLEEEESAGHYYTLSAQNGNPIGQHLLGLAYANGECGMKQDYTQALDLFALSGKQGYPPAQFAVGLYLYLGVGTERNLEWSKAWMQAAAENGHEQAKDFLEKMAFTDEAADKLLHDLSEPATTEQQSASAEQPTNNETKTSTHASSFTPGIQVNKTHRTDTHLWTLKSIDLRSDCTIVYYSVTSLTDDTYVHGTKDTRIEAGRKQYNIITTVGIAIEPEMTIIRKAGTTIDFYSVFPTLPKKTKTISINSKGTKFENIDIRRK